MSDCDNKKCGRYNEKYSDNCEAEIGDHGEPYAPYCPYYQKNKEPTECEWVPMSDLFCPQCDEFDESGDFFAKKEGKYKYCPWCGKPIKQGG